MKALRSPAALLAIAIAALCVASFFPTRHATFLGDDHPIVRQNRVVRSADFGAMFGKPYWWGVGGNDTSLYRPVTLASFTLSRSATGEVDPHAARWVSIALHGLCAFTLFLLVRRMGAGDAASALAALWFAAHPIHVAAVAPLVGRADILALCFTLAAARLQAGPQTGERGRLAPWLAAVCAFAALGSKESALAAPAILVAVEFALHPRRGRPLASWARARATALAPTGLAILAWLALRAHATGAWWAVPVVPVSENPLANAVGVARWATPFAVLTRYLGLMAFPRTLSADYSGNVIPLANSWFEPAVLIGVCAFAILAGLCAGRFLPSAGNPAGRAAWSLGGWLFAFPYIVIANLVVPVGMLFAERFAYAPSAGFCVLAALALQWVGLRGGPRGPAVVALCGAVVAVVLAWRSNLESRHWVTDESLHSRVLESQPRSPRAAFTLGAIRLQQGREDEALDFFERAIENYPTFSTAWFEKGRIELRRGEFSKASDSLGRASEINPYNPEITMALGDALSGAGRWDEAAEAYRAAAERGFPGAAERAAVAKSRADRP